jgi:hypothetical protein
MTAIEELTDVFRQLGARDPEGWARSQVDEGINQLHRFLFLRQAWSLVIPEGDCSWIDAQIANSERVPGTPFAGTGRALGRLLDSGAERELIAETVRGMQAELLFGLCYLLEDPGLHDEKAFSVGWALVETDENGEPTASPIVGIHESVLETDPTGREMRPREP